MPLMRFHRNHGANIDLEEDEMVAYRKSSFAHAISFSEKPLDPHEIFMIEIDKNERGWSGYLRMGLTQHDPNTDIELPQYALPDLSNMGRSWIHAVTKSHNRVWREDVNDGQTSHPSILGESEYVSAGMGCVKQSMLKANRRKSNGELTSDILPTDVGSRIGITYVTNGSKANMHFIINGEDQGPCHTDIPYKDAPLYAVVDVYGTTKKLRIVQLYSGALGSLMQLCRVVILRQVSMQKVLQLPLPNKLKEFLVE